MKPSIKKSGANTYHTDGSVSYWSVYRQQWQRALAANVPSRELAAMSDGERRKVTSQQPTTGV